MTQYSFRCSGDLDDEIQAYAGEYDSRSEAMRELVKQGLEYNRIQAENERLHRAQTQLIEQREEHGELVEYVEREKSLQERELERRDAPAWKRAKWWVFGR